MARRASPLLSKEHYEMLAALRHALREFLRFSQDAARAAGIPPQQHQALLAIKGYPEREYVTIGELAERLQVRHHSAVGLVDRLARRGLVRRVSVKEDRRRVHVSLTAKGETLIERLSEIHLAELREIRPKLRRLLDGM
jgi:DNA-binding MarR family transcriptional regulator